MFLHAGFIHFPEIPFLIIEDVWLGVEADANRLLYKITRGIWSRNYVIVGISNYVYNLYGNLGTFHPRNLEYSTTENSTVKDNAFSWISGTKHLYRDPIRGWVIDSASFGDGNYYEVSWGYDTVTASPCGPWTEDEDNPPTKEYLDIDWPRLQRSSSGLGTGSEVGSYTPATTYVNGTVVGNIQVGIPYWQGYIDGASHVVVKTRKGYEDPHGRGVSYAFEDNLDLGFKWNSSTTRYEYSGSDGLYYADTPSAEASWSITHVDSGGSSASSLSWGGWKRGNIDQDTWMFEIARIV